MSQVLQEGSRVTVDWTKPVSLKCQTGEGRGGLLWALEFLLAPKDCSLSQQKGMFHRKGRLSLLLSMVFQSGPERPGQELGVWLSG